MPPQTRILTRRQVADLLTIDECIPAMSRAFAAHFRGDSLGTRLMHIEALGGEFHIKGGGLSVQADDSGTSRSYVALKANGGFFGGPSRGVASIRGVVLLFDASNGDVLAVMDSRDITAVRTAATTALAAQLCGRPDARVATICGCGGQARRHLLALRAVRPSIGVVHVWSRTHERATAFCQRHAADLEMRLVPAKDLDAATLTSDVVITCTPSKRWFLGSGHVRAGTFIAAVGADSPDKQEIEPALVARSRLITDLTAQCAHVGELHHAIDAGVMSVSDVHAELGAIAAGASPGGWNPDLVTIFDSTGTALQDAAAAALVYHRAQAGNIGTLVDFLE